MSTVARVGVETLRRGEHRREVRYVAAALSGGCAVVYFAIGLGFVYPVGPAGEATGLLFFGVAAGLAFVVGAALLVGIDRRILWTAGAAFQVLVIVMYFAVAEKRTPPYETWGILLKIAQLTILAALVYLVATPWGKCPCAYCTHHRRFHRGRCLRPACPCDEFV